MTKQELGQRIYAISHLTGSFRLRSGQISNEYFDKYRFESKPDILESVAYHMMDFPLSGTEVFAGLEMGGIPIATMLSHVTGAPVVFVRKQAKDYGTCQLVEGGDVFGKRVVIIEDVVTSGEQIIESATQLRDLGGTVSDVLCVIDREEGGKERLAEVGLPLHALFTMTELADYAERGSKDLA